MAASAYRCCAVPRARAAHDDHEAGKGEQRYSGAGGAGQGVEVAVGEREHGRGDQQIPDEERQLADHQRGDGGEGAEPAPPGERARHAPGHERGIRNSPRCGAARAPAGRALSARH